MVSRRVWVVALFSLVGCDGDPPSDAGVDAGLEADAGSLALYDRCEDTMPPGTEALAPVASTLVGTIAPMRAPLDSPGALNPATERGELRYREMGLDAYGRGPGWERVRRTELGGATAPGGTRRSIAYFVHYADFQLVDDESPTRLGASDSPAIPGGLRSQEAYLPRAVSAMNRTLARIARPERPYDFAVISGDCADSAQENELRWVIDLMNGAPGLHTDSGDDDDLIPGPGNDPKDPFDPVAFPGPWLYVAGNHDVLVVGITPLAERADIATGGVPVAGTRDYRLRWGAMSMAELTPDPARRLTSREDIVAMLRADTGAPGPVGHGFAGDEDLTIGANWTHDAVPGLLRIVNLDTSDPTGGSNGLVMRETVDGFLIPALDAARDAGVLVMVASHHATSAIDVFRGQLSSEVVPGAVPPEELQAIVAGYDNVIAWLVGHDHVHRVRPIAGPDAARPGYWEVMTAAMADYPGQARVVEVVDNGDGTLSILGTLVDFDESACDERRYRRLLLMEHLSGWGDPVSLIPANLNVELVIPTPASAAAAVAAASGHARIESETTLRGD